MNQTSRNQNAITRNDLISFKTATAAAPTTQMQVIRLFEMMQSSIGQLGAMATVPTKGKECARKGGHTLLTRTASKNAFCHECGAKITSATELRPEVEVGPPASKGHGRTKYWLADGHGALWVR